MFVIAIDGPAASGKGALARKIAQHFGMEYLDTGKLYRAVGVKLIESGYNIDDAENHSSKAAAYAIKMAEDITIQDVNSRNLSSEEVGKAASIVSAIPGVRAALLEFQRRIADSRNGAVLDGRDIGTVVCPNADFKFFITANVEIRAQRRHKELQNQGNGVIYTDVLEDLKRRDERDSKRKIAPLRASEDAICIDTTALSMEGVLEQALRHIETSKNFKRKSNNKNEQSNDTI